MNIQKFTNYLVIGLGVLGAIFLALILAQGDDTIEMNAMQGDFGYVSYIILLAQIVLAIAVAISLGFSIKNLVSDKNKLKMYTRRASLISGGMMLLSSALVGRMYYLQVTSRDKYELLAEQNRISMRLLAPTRGDIIDRYGRPIATSTTDYRVNVIPEETEELQFRLQIVIVLL